MNAKESVESKQEQINVGDLLKYLYQHEMKDIQLNIIADYSSNLGYIQTTPRDVCMDLLTLPEVIENGQPVIKGVRIHMPYAAAQRLAETILGLIQKVQSDDTIEVVKDKKTSE
jgi:hypothetical protein